MSATKTDFGLGRIGQVAITVQDVDKAVAFYRDKLGVRFLFQVPNMAFFDCDGVRLMLALPEKQKADLYSSILYYKVDNIQEAFETLVARGVAFEGKPHLIAKLKEHDLWMAFFRDLDRNLLALMSEVPQQ